MKRSLEGARILIVEDEYFLADDLARALRNAGAEPVGPVATVGDAEAYLASAKLDAAILDLNLRGRMASDFVQRLASTRLPCLVVSGYADDAVSESIQGVPCLEKPVSPKRVVEAIARELLRAA